MALSTPEINPPPVPGPPGVPAGMPLVAQWSLRLVVCFVLLASVLFLSAWSLSFWQAGVYLLAVFVPVIVVSVSLFAHNPDIIQRRLQTAERSHSQQALIRAFRPLFLLMMFVPGL